MKKTIKNALETVPQLDKEHDLIIANKTYNVKELNSIFNVNTLMLVDSKRELIKYENMAKETGVKHFKNVVDIVWKRKFAV